MDHPNIVLGNKTGDPVSKQSITIIKNNLELMIDSLSTIRGLTTEQRTLVNNVAETLDTLATIIHQLHNYMKTLG